MICLNTALFEKNNRKLGRFLEDYKPDIVCLQEVTRKVGPKVDDGFIKIESIYQATGKLEQTQLDPIWIIRDFVKSDFHGHQDFSFEFGDWLELGLLTRTKYRIKSSKLIFVAGKLTKQTDWSNWPKVDNRAVQVTDLAISGSISNLRLINYHGFWSQDKLDSPRAIKANRRILELANDVNYPVIVVGDFNLFPDTRAMNLFSPALESLVDTYEIKTTRPGDNELSHEKRNVIDYVWISRGIKVLDFQVPKVPVSDHLPLILDFELAES